MTATYTGDLSDATQMVRFRLGDTDTATALLSDEEIDYHLDTLALSEDDTVGTLARVLYAKYARAPKVTRPDGSSRDLSAALPVWKELADRFDPSGRSGTRIRSYARPQRIAGTEYT